MSQQPCVYCGRTDNGLGQIVEQMIQGVKHTVTICGDRKCKACLIRDMNAVLMRSSLDARAYYDVNSETRSYNNGRLVKR
jgi:hypothetical protein